MAKELRMLLIGSATREVIKEKGEKKGITQIRDGALEKLNTEIERLIERAVERAADEQVKGVCARHF